MTKGRGGEQRCFRQQHPGLAIGAAAEHNQAAGGGADHEQRDQAERLDRTQPMPFRKTDAHPCRVAAHEGDEQAAEMQEADAVDIAGQRAQGAGQGNVAA